MSVPLTVRLASIRIRTIVGLWLGAFIAAASLLGWLIDHAITGHYFPEEYVPPGPLASWLLNQAVPGAMVLVSIPLLLTVAVIWARRKR